MRHHRMGGLAARPGAPSGRPATAMSGPLGLPRPGRSRRSGSTAQRRDRASPAGRHRPGRWRAADGGRGATRVVLTFSGEMYNFTELRDELVGLGHQFTTRSDTEVVLRAYLEWGERTASGGSTGCSRSRSGTRGREELAAGPGPARHQAAVLPPLRDGLLFGSEPKALLASPVFDAVLDDARPGRDVRDVRHATTRPRGAARTPRGPPGWSVRVRPDRRRREQQYWRLDRRPTRRGRGHHRRARP